LLQPRPFAAFYFPDQPVSGIQIIRVDLGVRAGLPEEVFLDKPQERLFIGIGELTAYSAFLGRERGGRAFVVQLVPLAR
jgi:hypothetical protein